MPSVIGAPDTSNLHLMVIDIPVQWRRKIIINVEVRLLLKRLLVRTKAPPPPLSFSIVRRGRNHPVKRTSGAKWWAKCERAFDGRIPNVMISINYCADAEIDVSQPVTAGFAV